MPPGRPAEFGRPSSAPVPAPPPPAAAPPDTSSPTRQAAPSGAGPLPGVCLASLRAAGAVAEPAPAPDPGCAIEEPVRLTGLADPTEPGRTLALPDRPVVACRFALAFFGWAGGVAGPVLKAGRSAGLKAIRTGPGFECRGRNRQAGAKLSAHGTGLALDIAGFEFADGTSFAIGGRHEPATEAAMATIRTAACGWFTTVLGPGSDPFHADHLHLDVMLHGSSDRYRICQ